MKTQCPFCKVEYEVEDQFLGQVAECNQCKKKFEITQNAPTDLLNPHVQNTGDVQKKFSNCPSPQKRLSSKKIKLWALVSFVLISCFGFFLYNYYENQKTIKWYEEQNKEIMSGALLDLSKFPGSSNVVFESYNDYPHADFISADGYIDMANAFGTKVRYKFWFHVEDYGTRNRFFFSIYGGQKFIKSKEKLGMFTLKDKDGETQYIHAEKLWDYNTLRKY